MIAKEPIVPSNKDNGKIDSFYTGEDQYYDELEAEEARLEKEAEKEQAEYEKQLDAEKAAETKKRTSIKLGKQGLEDLSTHGHVGADRNKRVTLPPNGGRVTSRLGVSLDRIDRDLQRETERADFERRNTFGGNVVDNAPSNIADLTNEFLGIQDSLDRATELSNLTPKESEALEKCSERLRDLEDMESPIRRRFIIYEGLLEINREINHILIGHLHDEPGLSGQSQDTPYSKLTEQVDESDKIDDIDSKNQ